MRRLLLLTCIFCCTFQSCREEEDLDLQNENHFFDLSTFVDSEIAYYKSIQCQILKQGEINQESDQKSISSQDFDWDKELKILSNMDIRKSAWVDYFSVDTIVHSISQTANDYSIHYETHNPKISVKKLVVHYNDSLYTKPYYIEAERIIKNWIFDSRQIIYYTAGTGMRVEGTQKILWGKEKKFNITTIYNCNHD